MNLPLVNQFTKIPLTNLVSGTKTIDTIISSNVHAPSLGGIYIPDDIDIAMANPDMAVEFILNGKIHGAIENQITKSLNNASSKYKEALAMMPKKTPAILSKYQTLYSSNTDMVEVNSSIMEHGKYLHNGQILFHAGGILNNVTPGQSIVTKRPLATSFCPVKAHFNGIHKGKYYNEGQANIILLTVENINKKAFVFKINGTNMGHEKEVLISSGVTLKLISKKLILPNYIAYAADPNHPGACIHKYVPAYLLHASIS